MRDFTVAAYSHLLTALLEKGYFCTSYLGYIRGEVESSKIAILRHDVDARPQNSLRLARIQAQKGVKGTYYFRVVERSYNERCIAEIVDLGHEIGYHYEDLSIRKGDIAGALQDFQRNLNRFRRFYPVQTICMHGSPLSRFDNRDIWKTYDYRDFGILAEPYFDIDFNRVFYVSDTGRKWNHTASSVRDKVKNKFDVKVQDTNHLVELINAETLPRKIMLNIHPQRWDDNLILWLIEFAGQNVKNVVKDLLVRGNQDERDSIGTSTPQPACREYPY